MLSSTFNHIVWLRLRLRQAIENRVADERGASLVEYALLVALIAMVCVGAVTFLGTTTHDSIDRSANSLAGAP